MGKHAIVLTNITTAAGPINAHIRPESIDNQQLKIKIHLS